MPRSCQSEIRLDSTPAGPEAALGVAHDLITSELDMLHQEGYFWLSVADSFPEQMDACTARPSSDCTDFASDTTTISLDCLIHLCAPACYGNYTTPPILQSIHYHATPGTTGSGTNVVTEGVIPELRNGVVNRQQLQTSTPGSTQTAEEQFFQLPDSNMLCCNGIVCEETAMCQEFGSDCVMVHDKAIPHCMLPDPLLLIPIQFSLVLSNLESTGKLDASQIEKSLGQQLGILNQAFRGRLDGCKGDCIDSRIHFIPKACMDAPYPCLELDWQIVQVAATHSQVEALLFGSVSDPETSDAWIGSTEGLAALKHVSSVLNPQRSALNVLVFQDDTAPLRMRATWPWQSSDDGLPLHGVMITSSGLPGLMRTGAFSQGKSLVHVVGHWLGLLHTYHSPAGTEPCDCTYNPGDFVADTPQQARANTLSCQADQVLMPCPNAPSDMILDSCPCASGLDDVKNFMDESPDMCLRRFSSCQAHRMHGAYWKYLAQEQNASHIHDMVQQTRYSRAAALANGHIVDDVRSPTQTGWEYGWCATLISLNTTKAVSFGASIGLGVLVWAAVVSAVLVSYTALRQKRRLRRRLYQFRDADGATANI